MRAISREAIKVSTTVTGIERINVPAPVCNNRIGKKESMVVIVPLVTAHATCPAPSIAAVLRSKPKRRKRPTFSVTTMALSTSSPRAITKPTIDICCKPKPVKSSQPKAIRIDIGIATTITKAERKPSVIKVIPATNRRPNSRLLIKSLSRFSTLKL